MLSFYYLRSSEVTHRARIPFVFCVTARQIWDLNFQVASMSVEAKTSVKAPSSVKGVEVKMVEELVEEMVKKAILDSEGKWARTREVDVSTDIRGWEERG